MLIKNKKTTLFYKNLLYDLFFGSDFYEEEPEIGCGYFLKLERTYFD